MRLIFILLITISPFKTFSNDFNFTIEGISLGDSLLNYMSESEILQNSITQYEYFENSNFYSVQYIHQENFNTFQFVQVELKKNDTSYRIYGIGGNQLVDDFKSCQTIQNTVDKKLLKLTGHYKGEDNLDLTYPITQMHPADPSGRSTVRQYAYNYQKENVIKNECYDFHPDTGYPKYFTLNVFSKEFDDFLNQK